MKTESDNTNFNYSENWKVYAISETWLGVVYRVGGFDLLLNFNYFDKKHVNNKDLNIITGFSRNIEITWEISLNAINLTFLR